MASPDGKRLIVFVHGWSVRSTDTYGRLPDRLAREAGDKVDVKHVWLSRYVSFKDEVRVEDLSLAFREALRREIGGEIAKGRRFAAITHSTGGPVVRDWWRRFHGPKSGVVCPMSHLVMLAPANFGSALAQLGKGTVGRLKSWFEGVEPGTGVLDWLELGSPESWALNAAWIESATTVSDDPPVFPFVLAGQTIDRKLYDHVNSYTGEAGSDGVVRVAAANLNAAHVRLVQKGDTLEVAEFHESPRVAMAVLPGRSHSGDDKGIIRSVRKTGAHVTLRAVLKCLAIETVDGYAALCDEFDEGTKKVQEKERVEKVDRILLPDSYYVTDRYCQVIVRLSDERAYALGDFDFLLTAGKKSSPDKLPQGFFVDRQRNRRHKGTLAYYLNHDVLARTPAVRRDGKLLRDPSPGADRLGFRVEPRPEKGFVHYAPAEYSASKEALERFLRPNATLLLDIVMSRIVREGAFTLTRDRKPHDFTDVPPSGQIGG